MTQCFQIGSDPDDSSGTSASDDALSLSDEADDGELYCAFSAFSCSVVFAIVDFPFNAHADERVQRQQLALLAFLRQAAGGNRAFYVVLS